VTRKFIPVEEAAAEWVKDPAFRAADDALEDEFALAATLIRARAHADMTQEQVAAAIGTTQAVVARLEGGRIHPTTRTLDRFAKATGTTLRISFDPVKPRRHAGRSVTHRLRVSKRLAVHLQAGCRSPRTKRATPAVLRAPRIRTTVQACGASPAGP
jgi:transcriptional regulator with XRE-family HTH domain